MSKKARKKHSQLPKKAKTKNTIETSIDGKSWPNDIKEPTNEPFSGYMELYRNDLHNSLFYQLRSLDCTDPKQVKQIIFNMVFTMAEDGRDIRRVLRTSAIVLLAVIAIAAVAILLLYKRL